MASNNEGVTNEMWIFHTRPSAEEVTAEHYRKTTETLTAGPGEVLLETLCVFFSTLSNKKSFAHFFVFLSFVCLFWLGIVLLIRTCAFSKLLPRRGKIRIPRVKCRDLAPCCEWSTPMWRVSLLVRSSWDTLVGKSMG